MKLPMGYSQWLQHGKKYGYLKNWAKEIMPEEDFVMEAGHSTLEEQQAFMNGYIEALNEIQRNINNFLTN